MNCPITAGDGCLYLIATCFGHPLYFSNSFIGALRTTFEISGRTASFLDAPGIIVRVESDERLDAYGIMEWWRRLGWIEPEEQGTHKSPST